MADLTDKTEWEKILLQNTSLYENHRYDWLQTTAGQFGIADIKSDKHRVLPLTLSDYSYRSFGTYRRSILCDTSLVKENETYFSEDYIIDQFYKTDNNEYIYGGIVMSNRFATNSNEATLEDIFCEFGYDFIQAVDTSIFVNTNKSKYFDNDKEVNGAWSILPIGSTYSYYTTDEITKENKLITEEVQYDGTYVPTVQELLDGSLYIIIKSGSLDPQKIYFNNKYMPSLFINDDKFPNTLNVDTNSNEIKTKYQNVYVSSNDYTYVINEQQTFKLCDITRYQRIACLVAWENIFSITNIQELKDKVEGFGINNKEYSLITAAWAEYTFKKTELNDNLTEERVKILYNITDENALLYNEGFQNYIFNNVRTPSLHIGTATSGDITVDIYFTVLLVLNGYSDTPPEIIDTPQDDAYEFNWYEYSTLTYVPQLLIEST